MKKYLIILVVILIISGFCYKHYLDIKNLKEQCQDNSSDFCKCVKKHRGLVAYCERNYK